MTLGAANSGGWRWAFDDYALTRIGGAIWQATLSTVATLAVAVPLAWFHHARAMPWTRMHMALHALPFVLPVFVIINGMRELFGPQGWVSALAGRDLLLVWGPLGTVVLAHAYYNYGFAARIIHTTLDRRASDLESSARVLGASSGAAFARISLPILLPALGSVALLVWLFSFTSFGIVLLLGQGALATPETLIYQNLGGIYPRPERAAAVGIMQLALNALLFWAYFGLQKRYQRTAVKVAPPTATRRSQILSWGFLLVGLAPLLAVIAGSFQVRDEWTLEAWRALSDASHPAHLPGFRLLPTAMRSLAYALGTALLSVSLAWGLATGLRSAGKWRRAAEPIAAMPLGISSVLLGLGYLLAFGGAGVGFRTSWAAIVVVHSLVAFPFVARIILPALDQIDARLDQAATILGASASQVRRRVHWPLMRPALATGAGFAAAISLGDFGASLLLARRDTMGLAVWINEHDVPFRLLMQAQSVALTAILMVMVLAVFMVAGRRAL